jgi:hypothetical protein
MMDELLQTANARLLEPGVLAALQTVSQRLQISSAVASGLPQPLGYHFPGLVPGRMRRALRECSRSCTGRAWEFEEASRIAVADSPLRNASNAERAAIRDWRKLTNIRALLEQEVYSAMALMEELEADRAALLQALDALLPLTSDEQWYQAAGEPAATASA